jgi:hypothetical protein
MAIDTILSRHADAEPLAPRKPGRPAGLGKVPGSGRKRGTPNGTTADAKTLIVAQGKPIEFLCRIVQGQRVRVGPRAGPGPVQWEYPSLQDRMRAAMVLAGKVVPDVRATEISGPGGAPLPAPAAPVQLNLLAVVKHVAEQTGRTLRPDVAQIMAAVEARAADNDDGR